MVGKKFVEGGWAFFHGHVIWEDPKYVEGGGGYEWVLKVFKKGASLFHL
jgi:hypothetical protein